MSFQWSIFLPVALWYPSSKWSVLSCSESNYVIEQLGMAQYGFLICSPSKALRKMDEMEMVQSDHFTPVDT